MDIKPKFEGLHIENYKAGNVADFSKKASKINKLLLCFVLEGELNLYITSKPYLIEKNSIIMIPPDTDVAHISESENISLSVFFISLDFISTYSFLEVLLTSEEIKFNPVIKTEIPSKNLIWSTVKLIRTYHAQTKEICTPESVQYLLYALLELVSKLYMPVIKSKSLLQTRNQDIIKNFFNLLEKYGHLERSALFYSDQLHLSAQYLSNIIKKETGKPIKQWISYMVIKHAKELLKTTPLSIKEVSNQLKFVDSSLFCRYFRRCTGITASSYRENYIIKSHNSNRSELQSPN
ncbi:helix-turn-helix transcriptional regulator [Elizabethkingia anophelis]|nr:helix-turn-helix transcriptional regulator [Elizabethkingia anophelis]AMR41821.1 transcriptional regulator [Elizabethkingia anophelis]AMX48461.1 transcriptional regulator [Elizabethkingia anophelis]AMX51919.1 transcriptional regulator [Elizabethkingia anophelis]AMX55309.1 transcriptional regulator [Elizabethkingia anophelis]EGT4348582.1 AraC family transcriptional regulator [Elizabethkingia anophelis]